MGCACSKTENAGPRNLPTFARVSIFKSLAEAGDATMPSQRKLEASSSDDSLAPMGQEGVEGQSPPPPPRQEDSPVLLTGDSEVLLAKSRGIKHTFRLRVGVLEGATFLNQYIVVDTLGRGSYGRVKLCLSTQDDELYAIKVVNRALVKAASKASRLGAGAASSARGAGLLARRGSGVSAVAASPPPAGADLSGSSPEADADADDFGGDTLGPLRREIDVMRRLRHPNLVRLHEVIEDGASGKVLMVMEYAAAGQLLAKGQLSPERRMPEVIAQYYFRQMAAGMAFLHANHVVHGDMKPDNVLLSGDSTVKIADFGQAHFFRKRDTFNRTLGTPAFLAPEVCAGETYRGRQADMWALGISLYLFIYGEVPFHSETVLDLYDQIAGGSVPYPEHVPVSMELQDLFRRILNPDPAARLTAEEMMEHAWVKGDFWASLLSSFQLADGTWAAPPEVHASMRAEDVAAIVFPSPSPQGASPVAGTSPRSGVAGDTPAEATPTGRAGAAWRRPGPLSQDSPPLLQAAAQVSGLQRLPHWEDGLRTLEDEGPNMSAASLEDAARMCIGGGEDPGAAVPPGGRGLARQSPTQALAGTWAAAAASGRLHSTLCGRPVPDGAGVLDAAGPTEHAAQASEASPDPAGPSDGGSTENGSDPQFYAAAKAAPLCSPFQGSAPPPAAGPRPGPDASAVPAEASSSVATRPSARLHAAGPGRTQPMAILLPRHRSVAWDASCEDGAGLGAFAFTPGTARGEGMASSGMFRRSVVLQPTQAQLPCPSPFQSACLSTLSASPPFLGQAPASPGPGWSRGGLARHEEEGGAPSSDPRTRRRPLAHTRSMSVDGGEAGPAPHPARSLRRSSSRALTAGSSGKGRRTHSLRGSSPGAESASSSAAEGSSPRGSRPSSRLANLARLSHRLASAVRGVQDIEVLHVAAGENLGTSDDMTSVLYIESGELEISWEARLPFSLSAVLGHALRTNESFSLDHGLSGPMDSTTIDMDIEQLQTDARSMTLTGTVREAAERAALLLRSAAVPGAMDDLLVTRRGPRQFIGALGMLDPAFYHDRWKASAMALTPVTLVRLTAWGLERFLEQNPLVQVHLRASIALTQAEVIKLESLEKIAECMHTTRQRTVERRLDAEGPKPNEKADSKIEEDAETAPANEEHDAMLDRFAVVHWLRDTFNTLGQDALSTLGLTSDLTPALRSSK
ncbi:hypothetical protein ACKKBG_A15290 [Auxenochlorella protothecoides x Auxenochlorella symbiontica]